jgi:hypothetical protein
LLPERAEQGLPMPSAEDPETSTSATPESRSGIPPSSSLSAMQMSFWLSVSETPVRWRVDSIP